MIRSWRERLGVYVGSIAAWLGVGYVTASSAEVTAAFDVYMQTSHRSVLKCSRAASFEVER